MKKPLIVLGAIAACGSLFSLSANAQFAKPEDAMKYRQSAFSVMGIHFSRVGAMVQGRVPFDAKAAQDDIAIVAMMSKLPWQAFGPGTQSSKTKPEVWSDAAKFKEAADKMQAEMPKLQAAARTGDLDTLKAQFKVTGQTCKSCHDAFKN